MTYTDTPTCHLDASRDVVTVDIGLWGALSRAAKLADIIARAPELTDQRLIDIGRLDKLYWQVLRWHGMFAVEFQIPQTFKIVVASPLMSAPTGALAFFLLHEITHLVHRREGLFDEFARTELEHHADQAAALMLTDIGLRHCGEEVDTGNPAADEALVNLGAMGIADFRNIAVELAAFIMRRHEESFYVEPPVSHLRWFVRRDEMRSRRRDDAPGPQPSSPLTILHDAVTRAQRHNRKADWDSLETLFARVADVATHPSENAIEKMRDLETLDELFHMPTYDLLVKLAEERTGRSLFIGTTAEQRRQELTNVRRQLREAFPGHAESTISRESGVPFTDIVSREPMSTLERAVGARYKAIHLGLTPAEVQWD
ncbi:hypothetical protein A5634_19675 [Mycobacterium asiaticum]|uniref:Uncharacterized protein n=1 Tax=Mycobacterium asiaticum TaxID=1790 RepID=A0A1A3P8E9_MYCAS|nr:hypothetical protein A5634_19675 [Mycobacterium asiaticum]